MTLWLLKSTGKNTMDKNHKREITQSTLKTKRVFMIYFSQFLRRLLEPSLKIKLKIFLGFLVIA